MIYPSDVNDHARGRGKKRGRGNNWVEVRKGEGGRGSTVCTLEGKAI